MAKGNAGKPSAFDSARPKASNSVEQIVTVGMPSFSSSIESWILHEVQEPQSPTALITTSHCTSSSKIASGAGILLVRLF